MRSPGHPGHLPSIRLRERFSDVHSRVHSDEHTAFRALHRANLIRTVTTAMQCAGNRRADMREVAPVSGVPLGRRAQLATPPGPACRSPVS